MKKWDYRSAALAFFMALASAAVIAQTAEPRYEELPNFHRVNERLYRGAQPKKEGMKKLVELGVKTIVNLRGESEDTRMEENEAKRLGLNYFNVPMSSVGKPTDEQVDRVFEILDATENAPVFVHCRRGADRTGVIVAIYRVTREGWTAERSIEEAQRYGLGRIQFRKRDSIKEYFAHQQQNSEPLKSAGR
jgi:uncharacterized protein (TIGR01244 family)